MRNYFLVFFVLSALGRTFYVHSGTGDDARTVAEAQSRDTPFKTLAKGSLEVFFFFSFLLFFLSFRFFPRPFPEMSLFWKALSMKI
jgi:hypothetical protein